MKRILIHILLLIGSTTLYSQQFNTAKILAPRHITAGVNPVFFDKNELQSGIFLHGGIGLNRKTDLAIRFGVVEGKDYFGGDIEWMLRKTERLSLSLITGMHVQYFIGLDAGLTASFPISKDILFFSGIDIDLNFERDIQHYTWVPIGLEVFIRKDISLIVEIDVPMSDWAWSIYGGGLVMYL